MKISKDATIDQLENAIDELSKLHETQIELLRKMLMMVRLRQHFPEAWVDGGFSTSVRGDVHRYPNEAQFVIRHKDGKEWVYDLMKLPWEAWPENLKAKYHAPPFGKRRNPDTIRIDKTLRAMQ